MVDYFEAILDALDGSRPDASGALADRPPAYRVPGDIYRATDQSPVETYVSDGSEWKELVLRISAVGDDVNPVGEVVYEGYGEGSLPTAGTEGRTVWNTHRKSPAYDDGSDYEYPVIADDAITSSTQVNNTAAQTSVFQPTVDAGSLQAGRVIETDIFGRYNTNDASSTFLLNFTIGGNQVASISSVAKNVNDAAISARMKFTVRSTGASGEAMVHTEAVFDDSHADAHHGTQTIDTTTAEDINATVEWDTADPGLSVTVGQGWVKELN